MDADIGQEDLPADIQTLSAEGVRAGDSGAS